MLYILSQRLIRNGADPRAKDSRDETALHVAAEEGKANIVRFLLGCGKFLLLSSLASLL